MIADLTYEAYQATITEKIQPAYLEAAADHVSFGGKFEYTEGQWHYLPYPGFAVLSMVGANPGHEQTIGVLRDIQQKLVTQNGFSDKVFLLPKASFHQTIANTLSSDRFEKQVRQVGLEDAYPQYIDQAFHQIALSDTILPLKMRLVGVSVFGSAWGIMGAFDNESDYNQILAFREQFYNQEQLNQLDIKRTRPFIGHVTLGYFDRSFSEVDARQFAWAAIALNQELAKLPLYFRISQAQLRKYDHLADFQYDLNYPTYSFLS